MKVSRLVDTLLGIDTPANDELGVIFGTTPAGAVANMFRDEDPVERGTASIP
jgi:hypothetical protein